MAALRAKTGHQVNALTAGIFRREEVGGDWLGSYTGGFFLGRQDTGHSSDPVMASAPIQGIPLTRSRCITVARNSLFES